MNNNTTFSWWDYAVFSLMLIVSLCIGIYHAVRLNGRKSTAEFLVAGHSMTLLPVALSLIATYESSIMMLGTPAEAYVYGFSWILGELGSNIGSLIDVTLMLALFRRLDLATPYQYFEKRFKSRSLRFLVNVMSCFGFTMYMSIVLYGQGVAIQAVTGLSVFPAIVVTAFVTITYTALGGLKAVIWTDVLQFIIMSTGLLVVLIKTTIDAGGVGEVWGRASKSGRLDISLDTDPTERHTLWNLLFGRMLVGLGMTISPSASQRISAVKTIGQARISLVIALCGIVVIIGTALSAGIAAYGYYSVNGCDPLTSGQIDSPNQLVPHLVMDLFRDLPGLPGLFLAALSSASLSTISSCLSAISIMVTYDLTRPFFPNMSEFKGLIIAKVAIVFSGVIGCMLAVLVSFIGSQGLHQITQTFLTITRSPIVSTFYIGAIFPFVNAKGAITGFVSGIGVMSWLIIGSLVSSSRVHTPYLPLGPNHQCPHLNTTTPTLSNTSIGTIAPYDVMAHHHNATISQESGNWNIYNLSYTLYSPMAMCVVAMVAVTVSLATGGLREKADPHLTIHLNDIAWWRKNESINISDDKMQERQGLDPSNKKLLTGKLSFHDVDTSEI